MTKSADKNLDEFLSLSESDFFRLCRKWTEKNLKIDIPKDLEGYDQWLNYFKHLPASSIEALSEAGKYTLNTEAYSALLRWKDILETPGRIDKIYQAGLTKPRSESKSIVELAKNNDRLGVLYAVRDQIAEKLEKGTGARDTASLAREMGEILDQIDEAEKRRGVKEGTKLASLVSPKRKATGHVRYNSYKAKMTIKEVESGED